MKAATLDPNADVRVGVFLAHRRGDLGAGAAADSFLTVGFRDFDSLSPPGAPLVPQGVEVRLMDYYHPRPGQSSPPRGGWFATNGVTFTPRSGIPPGAWRRVIAEITPERLRVFWRADAEDRDAPPQLVCDLPAAAIETKTKKFRRAGTMNAKLLPADPLLLPTDWHPAGGFGVWTSQSGLSFRNVTVRRLPPE